jgi:CBS domain-containing protein
MGGHAMLKNLDLQHYLLKNPVCVHPDASLFDAIHLILVNRISGLCVVDDEGRLVGLLSELDCLRGVLGATYNDSAIGSVRDVMATEGIQTAKLGDAIVDVAEDMLRNKRRRRPVVDRDGRLIGQISIRQILRAVKEFSAPADRSERD